jgi:hypothetical protein
MSIARASWLTGIVLAVLTLQAGAADASRRIVIKAGEGHAGLRIAIGQDHAAATSKKSSPLEWMKRRVNIVKTRLRLNREYKNVFRLGKDLVVSNDTDLVERPASKRSGKAAGEAQVVNRETGAALRPIRLLRKSFLLDRGPGHKLALSKVEELMDDAFEVDYQPQTLKLERTGDKWLAHFEGDDVRGVAALKVGRSGRWYLDDDEFGDTWARNGLDSYNIDE